MIRPGATIGIIGGGQLGRMTAMAAAELGYLAHIYTPETDSPASQVAHKTTVAAYDDQEALRVFASAVDVVTFEFENVPHECLELLEQQKPVFPNANVLRVGRNRIREKSFVNALGIGTAKFRTVTSLAELQKAAEEIGFPSILKTAELGYDGKGQITLKDAGVLESAWNALHTHEAILEGFVDFRMEISVIVARGENGDTCVYTPVQNNHKNHILSQTIAPAPLEKELLERAEEIALAITNALDVRGLLAVEMFVTTAGEVLVNEIAPRPHNSGHWTMDACATSQFEQLVRAVCGLPLGSTQPLCAAEMHNLIGDEVLGIENYLANKNAKLHLYGKKDIRPGRKMGHVNILRLTRE